MAVKSKNDLLTALNKILGDNSTDDALGLIEDITDTFTDFETKTKDTTDWKTKYDENDASWRKKYHDRFFETGSGTDPKESKPKDPEPKPEENITFDDLFKEEK